MPIVELEKQLQLSCERLLALHGFSPRTPLHLREPCPTPRSGWYIHVHRALGNPIMLDLLILHKDGSYLEVELKRPGGTFSPEQKYILSHMKSGTVGYAYTFDEFESLLKEWIRSKI